MAASLAAIAETRDQPNGWQLALLPPPPPPTPVAFLEKDIGVSTGARLPFVGDDAGHVKWVFAEFRVVPRAAG
jgi:hypothetical protein